jgi:hypothetical protein
METTAFVRAARMLRQGFTRRAILALLGGLGLAAAPGLADARKVRRKQKPRRGPRQVGTEKKSPPGDIVLATEGVSDAERIALFTNDPFGPRWRHSHLTVAVKAAKGDKGQVAAIHQAIAMWSDVLDRHFDGAVTLTDDPHAAKTADIHVTLTPKSLPHGFNLWSGFAVCDANGCGILVKTKFPPGHLIPGIPGDITPEVAGRIALHELGHALGLGHAQPEFQTNDLMDQTHLPWVAGPFAPVLSDCGLKVLDEVWSWAVQGVDPYQSPLLEVVCAG